jgi:hypothetical protein
MVMEGTAELAFGIAALVYAAGLALFRLPLLQVRRWGWTLMMHSWSGVAVLTVLGSYALLKGVMANFVSDIGYGWALAATFDDAIQSATMARDMALAWVNTINIAAIALGSLMSIIMLALLPTWVTGVGILLSAIASFIISGVFGTLIFMQKLLAGVILFMEGVVAFVGLMQVAAPAMFVAGLIAFMIPFARRLGKTFMVMGAVFTIALPVAIVAAAPPPGFAERRIMETADIQALGIASKAVADLQGGVRYTVYDRENDTIWYPFLLAEPLKTPEVDRDKVCGKIPRGANYTCEQLIEIVEEILKTPEKAIFDTGGGGYYNAYDEGYRTTLMNATYDRKVWFLNMWITLHDKGPKNVTVHEIPSQPDPQARGCVMGGGWYDPGTWTTGHGGGLASSCENAYLMWKTRWENFWKSTKLYNETSEWMVAENRNSTFVWFTEQPWGTPKEDLNKFEVKVEKKRESHWEECDEWVDDDNDPETPEVCVRWRYYTQAYYHGNKSTYFVYLNMSDWEVCWETDTTNIGHGGPGQMCVTRKGRPDWSYEIKDFHGPKEKYPPNQIDIRNETYRHNATMGGYECNVYWRHGVFDASFAEIKQEGFIDDYGPYTLKQSVQSVDRDEPLVLDAPTEEKKVVVEVEIICTAWSYAGYPILPAVFTYEYRVDFEASDSMPYLPKVDWSKFDDDEKYQRELAAGKYVPDRITIGGASYGVENMRQEWSRYQNFRPGLYRDGPSQEASRRINAKLLEYKEESWETNATIFNTGIPIAKAVTDIIYKNAYGAYAGSNIPITSHRLLVTESGSIGILKPLSELIGTSFAIGFVIGLLALVVDTFNGLVGGQSVMMGYLMNKVGNISAAGRFFSQYLGAIQRMSHANMLGRYLARRMENQMLKAAFEQRWMNRQQWQKLAEQRKNVPFRVRMMERVVGRERLERMLDSRNPLAQMAARGYALSVAREGLKDPEFKKALEMHMALEKMEKKGIISPLDRMNIRSLSDFQKALEEKRLDGTLKHMRKEGWLQGSDVIELFEKTNPVKSFDELVSKRKLSENPEFLKIKNDVDKTITGIAQSRPVRMDPTEWAEGFAAMMKNPNLTTLEKVTLLDSFARSNPGRDLLISAYAAPFGELTKKVGEKLEDLGLSVGSEKLVGAGLAVQGFGRGFDGHITAPAAFQVGATPDLIDHGIVAKITQGYVPDASVDWKAYGMPADLTVKRHDLGGSPEDVGRVVRNVESYGTSDEVKQYVNNPSMQHMLETVTPPREGPPPEVGKTDDKVVVTVQERVSEDNDMLSRVISEARQVAEEWGWDPDKELQAALQAIRIDEDGTVYTIREQDVHVDRLHEFRQEMEAQGNKVETNSYKPYSSYGIDEKDAQDYRSDPVNDNAWPEAFVNEPRADVYAGHEEGSTWGSDYAGIDRRWDAGGEYNDVTDAKGFVTAFGSPEDVKYSGTDGNLPHPTEVVNVPIVEKDDYQPVRVDPINDNAWPEWMESTDSHRASDYTDMEQRGSAISWTKDGKPVKGGDGNE